jgi:Ca-activated chloride channel family protein
MEFEMNANDRDREIQGPGRLRGSVLLLTCLLMVTLGGGLAARTMTEKAHSEGGVEGGASASVASVTAGPVHLSARIDRGKVLRGSDGEVKLELILSADEQLAGERVRVPTDLIVVLDRSGSMQGTSFEQALAAVRELIAGLAPDDRFALVTYSSDAELPVALERATLAARGGWESTLASLHARGGTNMSAALDLASTIAGGRGAAGRTARVILLSDGHANQGDHSLTGLRTRAARAVAGEYVLSAVGIGQGFDENLMSTLSDAGTGNFYYVRESQALGGVFAGEFAAARETVASALRVVVREGDGVRVLDAAGYPLARTRGEISFQPGPLFSGQERRVWLTLQAPTTAARDEIELGLVSLFYVRDGRSEKIELEDSLRVACVEDERDFYAGIDADAWSDSVTVDDYNSLRQRVARMVREGRSQPAMDMISEYEESKRKMNVHVQSPLVTQQLESLDELSSEVSAAAPSPAMRGALGKKLSADAIDGRRIGAKK